MSGVTVYHAHGGEILGVSPGRDQDWELQHHLNRTNFQRLEVADDDLPTSDLAQLVSSYQVYEGRLVPKGVVVGSAPGINLQAVHELIKSAVRAATLQTLQESRAVNQQTIEAAQAALEAARAAKAAAQTANEALAGLRKGA